MPVTDKKNESTEKDLFKVIKSYVAESALVPPLTIDELKFHTSLLIKNNPQWNKEDKYITIMLNNSLWEDTVSAIPFERRILLLPQCLKDPSNCKADMDEFGLLCKQCGSCLIGEFQEEAEKLGYIVLVAEGTSVVTKLLESGKIDAVIGVSCITALEKAFSSISADAIPGIAIPLNEEGCIGTEVDRDQVMCAIQLRSNETGSCQVDINSVKEATQTWFEYNSLYELLKNKNEDFSDTENIALMWMVKSGKRWRPFLTAAVYSAITDPGNTLSEKIIKPALAVECFHKASLIHDDIEDNDDLRYGDMTLHKQHGIPIALNIGDLLIGEGYRLIGEASVSKESIAKMLLIASECHKTLSLGQGAELLAMKNMVEPLSFDEIKKIFQAKTSPAFEAALAIGAACAEADEEIFPILKQFSQALGMAYQIKDDLDDFVEIDDEISHPRFRCSLLLSLAYDNSNDDEKQVLVDFLKNKVNSEEFIKIISASKNMEKAYQLYEHYKNEAIRSLATLKNAPLKSFLRRVISKICSG